jgi:DNA polymerase I-like protein with 3'-5' exonuclease and polymerase domains
MKILAADIETGSKDELHSFGPGFFRLGAWCDVSNPDDRHMTTDPYEMLAALNAADAITFHNGCNYDALVFGKYYGANYEDLCRKMFDTFIVERHLNPVAAQGAQPSGYYKLGPTSMRYGGPDKVDEVERLARKHKGFHLIPQDDPEFIDYLWGDIDAQRHLFLAQRELVSRLPAEDQRYIRREHAVGAAMGRITLEGFRVDVDETMRRWSAGQKRLEDGKQLLHEKHGMPLDGKKPHVTNLGKAAFRRALLATGISEMALDANWPTNKDGSLSTAKDTLNAMIAVLDKTKPEAAELCRTILAMNGERTVYGTVLDHLNEGRVHPYIGADQSSGRWSMKKPGLTVFGKRGGKAVERGIMLPDNDDEVLVAIDFDQIDARGVAGMCQDPDYAQLFQPGKDLHSEVAWLVFRNPECRAEMDRNNGRCDCPLRERAKIGAHGFSYGLGAGGLSRQLGVDMPTAREFIDGMIKAFPVLNSWKEEQRRAAGALGWDEVAPSDDTFRILRTGHGRPVRVERSRAYTQATAQLGQGTTRDLVAESILRLSPDRRRRIRAVIHDELVFSIPKAWGMKGAQEIADSMRMDFRGIAITAGVSRLGKNWAGCYGAQYETAA